MSAHRTVQGCAMGFIILGSAGIAASFVFVFLVWIFSKTGRAKNIFTTFRPFAITPTYLQFNIGAE
jgi:hypothetical protein